MGDLNGHRNANGRFAVGNPGGPGRPRRAVEHDYLASLADAVPLSKWKKIVRRAVEDAEKGDPKARRWLGEFLMGKQPASLTMLAVTELAGTMDDELRTHAAGLRTDLLRRKIINRTSAYPDLNPSRPAGHGNVGGASPAAQTGVEALQPSRNGHPG